jgi:molybdate transport system substrate-binding protein
MIARKVDAALKSPSSPKRRVFDVVATVLCLLATVGCSNEVRVMTSGAFTAAYLELVPEFERATHKKVVSAFGASMGNTPDSIPNRLKRGEPVDVVIIAAPALDELIKQGKIEAGSRRDLVRSRIGMVVRAGAPKPDISSVEALKRTLLEATSIAYSDSASGVYISNEMFQRLGIANQVLSKSKKIDGTERVAAVVARGDAQIGFQQVSELISVPGIDYVGTLPSEVQKITIFSAGVASNAAHPRGARALIEFLASPTAAPAIKKSGLEPITFNQGDANTPIMKRSVRPRDADL